MENKSASGHGRIGVRGPRILFAAEAVPVEPAKPKAESPTPEATKGVAPKSEPVKPEGAQPGSPKAATPEAPPGAAPKSPSQPPKAPPAKKGAPIIVAPGPGGTIIASEDIKALDEFEQLLQKLAGNVLSGKPELTIFYLKHAKAAAVAETLDMVFGGGTLTGDTGDSLLGDLAGAALGPMGGGIMGALLGGGPRGGAPGAAPAASPRATGPIQITPDSRLNALIVRATPTDLDAIYQLLQILDQKDSPEEVLAAPKPRMIPVYNTQAEEVANVVRQVYQDRMVTASGAGGPPNPAQVIMALQNLRRGRGGGGAAAGRASADEPARMSIGVDVRTNSLVVAAPDALFQEVKELVAQLDDAAVDSNQTVQVVTLRQASPDAVRRALAGMVGSSVQFGSSSARASSPATPGPFFQPGSRGMRGFFQGGPGGMGFGGAPMFPGGGFRPPFSGMGPGAGMSPQPAPPSQPIEVPFRGGFDRGAGPRVAPGFSGSTRPDGATSRSGRSRRSGGRSSGRAGGGIRGPGGQ